MVAGLALLLLIGSPYLLSVLPQTHLTIHLSPGQTVYAPNQQVSVAGTLTCSGMCPMAAAGYGYMDVKLEGSWGWSQTVQTNGAGIYSCALTLPSTLGAYQISGVFYQNGSPAASATVNFQIGSSPITTTSTTTPPQTSTHTSALTSIVATTTHTQTSTGTTTSQEVSTQHTTTTITSGTGTTSPSLEGAENWLTSKTTIRGYDVPNWWFIAGFLGVLVLLWLRRRS